MLSLLMQELQKQLQISFRVILGNVSGTLKKVVEFPCRFDHGQFQRELLEMEETQTGKTIQIAKNVVKSKLELN
jgi:hypothetical protein